MNPTGIHGEFGDGQRTGQSLPNETFTWGFLVNHVAQKLLRDYLEEKLGKKGFFK